MPFELPEERHAEIVVRLQRDGRIVAAGLAREFGTSEDTIRRDLRDLASAGLCRRVYGGALRISPASGPVRERETADTAAKAALGVAVGTLLRAGQTVLIDSGSTNLAVARALPADMGLTVVTNAPGVAAVLAGRPGTELIMIGGRVDPRIGASFGARACRDLAAIRADTAILGACAIATTGVAVFDGEEAEFKRAAVEAAAQTVVALTTGKLSTAAPFGFAPLDAVATLVVEADAPEALLQALTLPAARILRAAPPSKADRP